MISHDSMIVEIYKLLDWDMKDFFNDFDDDSKRLILKTLNTHIDNFIKIRVKYLTNPYSPHKETRGEKTERQKYYSKQNLLFLFSAILNGVLGKKKLSEILDNALFGEHLNSANIDFGKKDYKKNNIDMKKNVTKLYKSLKKIIDLLVKDKGKKLQKKYKHINKYTRELNKKFNKKSFFFKKKKEEKKIKICKNDTDFITLDNIKDIPREKITYVKLNNGIFCFDTESFKDLVKHAKNQRVRGDCIEENCRDWFYPINVGFNVFINKKNYESIIEMINNNVQGQEFILTNKRRVDFTTGNHIMSEKTGLDDVYDLVPSTNYLIDLLGGKKRKGKNKKSKKIRKHRGINQKTGRLNKEFRYSGKILKSGLKQIIKKK